MVNPSPRRGDVWWAESEAWSRRPVLVLTRDDAIEWLTSLVVVPMTTTIRDIPTEVLLDEDDGLPRVCVATMDNVTVAPRTALVEHITRLGAVRMHEVCTALQHATDC